MGQVARLSLHPTQELTAMGARAENQFMRWAYAQPHILGMTCPSAVLKNKKFVIAQYFVGFTEAF
jgi:hypothetical protein